MTDNEYIQELARVREVLRRFRPLECDVEYLLACKDPKNVSAYAKAIMVQTAREISYLRCP